MNILKILFLLVTVNITYGQTTLVDFSPKSKAYSIYYPKNYMLNEEEIDGNNIVTMTNPESGLNITISSYAATKKIEQEDLIELLSGFVKDIKKSDWKTYRSKFDVVIEGSITKEKDNWIWWGIASDKKTVIISINKTNQILDAEIKLMRFIIDKLEIH